MRTVPLVARLSFFFVVVGGAMCGLVVGMWLLPAAIVFAHDGVGGFLANLPVGEFVFPTAPAFLGPDANGFKIACSLVGLLGMAIAGTKCDAFWRKQAVRRGWLTEREAKTFSDRSGGIG